MNEVAEQIERVRGPLREADAAAVGRLARAAEHVDRVEPISEQPRLWLRDPGARVTHLLVRAADDLAGYAQLDLGSPATASAELVVHPLARRHGVGSALLQAAQTLARAERRSLTVWAYGDLPAARALARSADLEAARELLRMGRTLAGDDDDGGAGDGRPAPGVPALPPGTSVRTFVVGQDEQAWLALNAAAFAHHPEQGRLTLTDLRAREREDWFDPAGFLLLERDGELVGAVWTKVEGDTGEIYVLAVSPGAQGQGLGATLTALALHHLAGRGLARAVLYTDGDNAAATRTYRRAGFAIEATSVQFASPTYSDVH